MPPVSKSCHSSEASKGTRHKVTTSSWIFGLLIALIPKCGLCVIAYSGAIAVCGTNGMVGGDYVWVNWITLGMAFLTMGLVAYNYRGKRTLSALGIMLSGTSMLVISIWFTLDPLHYYFGAGLLMLGVWVNASFLYFYRKWQILIAEFAQNPSENKVESRS